MIELGLGQLTAVEATTLEYIDIAADSGCQRVSLFVRQPGAQGRFPLTTRENFAVVRERLRATGLQVANIECFMLVPGVDVETFRPELELGAELGARGATALLYDNDEARVRDNLSQLCRIASQAGVRINVEFMPLAPLGKTIGAAVALIEQIGAANLGLCVDLLHLIRSGGTPADVAALDPQLINCVQLCDSIDLGAHSDYAHEAGAERLAPGDGKLPVQDFLKSVPTSALLELEVPQSAQRPASMRVPEIVAAARRQIELAGL